MEHEAGGAGERFPPWYTNLADTSWQLALEPNADDKLGLGPNHPVRVCGAAGQQAYLASLRCTGGADPFPDPFAATAARKEHLRPLIYPRIVDRYEVPCGAGTVDLYVSPYHCSGGHTVQVPPGFEPRY